MACHNLGSHAGDGHTVGGHNIGGHAVGGHKIGGHAVGGRKIGGHAVGGHRVGGHRVEPYQNCLKLCKMRYVIKNKINLHVLVIDFSLKALGRLKLIFVHIYNMCFSIF